MPLRRFFAVPAHALLPVFPLMDLCMEYIILYMPSIRGRSTQYTETRVGRNGANNGQHETG